MKRIKRLISIFITTMIFLSAFITPASAANPADIGAYAKGLTETVKIENVNYTFHYFYDVDGNRAIEITEEDSNVSDVIVYNESAQTKYLNDDILATLEELDTIETIVETNNNFMNRSLEWESLGSYSNRITWAQGVAVAVLAGLIAVYLACTGGAVLAIMGWTTLSGLAYAATGGTIAGTLYRRIIAGQHYFRDIWTFTANTGDKYGPFTTYYP